MIRFAMAFLVSLALPSLAAPVWGLQHTAPEECAQAATLARLVEAHLGRPVFGPSSSAVIDGVVTRTSTGWTAKVSVVSRSGAVAGSREVAVEGDSCDALTPRLVMIIELSVSAELPADPRVEPQRPRSVLVPVVKDLRDPPRSPLAWALVGGGLGLAVAGGVLMGWSLSTYELLQAQRVALMPQNIAVPRDQFDTLRATYPASWALLSLAVVSLAAGVVLNLLDLR